MTNTGTQLRSARRQLNSPRAAAVAGILFAILFITSMVLIRLSIPEALSLNTDWVRNGSKQLQLALTLVPLAGIAFLWFIGVIRDHIGTAEDRLFSTVFLGSCLLFLAMIFVSAAVAGALLASAALFKDPLVLQGFAVYSRAFMLQISNVYASRMAAVIMTSLATIWLRTGKMPRWMGFTTYALALVLLLVTSLNLWVTMIFPIWVFTISVFMLIMKMRDPNWGVV